MANFRLKLLLTYILLTISSGTYIYAQEVQKPVGIKISTDKVKIDGKYYLIHIVQPGENLFSISKAYNVSQIEIAMENPDIYLGVQVNQAIKIPVKEQETLSGDEDENYIYHVVRRRETVSSLTRKYKISKQEILAANPDITDDIKVNQVVLIPKKRLSTIGSTTQLDHENFYYHEVKPREGYYSLKRQYGVSEEVVKHYNHDLVADGLKLGTILRIPKNPNDTTIVINPVVINKIEIKDNLISPEKTISTFVCDTFVYNKRKNIYNVALLLPFTLISEEPIDSLLFDVSNQNIQSIQNQIGKKIPSNTANFLDFYQGVLIALDSLKAMGMSINLNVYNTERKVETTLKLLNEKGLRDANLIIGPVFPECIKPIADFALEQRIPMISPLSSSKNVIEKNPYLFQINPTFNTLLQEFFSRISLCANQNIVLLHEDDSTTINEINYFKKLLDQRIAQCPYSSQIHFKEVNYSPGIPSPQVQERISQSLVLDKENLILVPSNNEAFVSDLLGNLHTLNTIHKYPISIFGYPRWQKFKNIQIEYYYQLQLHLFMPFYVDFNNTKVKSFVAKYRESFRAEPSQYAFQGFDVMFFFLTAMKNYGLDFQYCLPYHNNNNLLQSRYSFKQEKPFNCYENSSVFLVRYTKDFEIIEVNQTLPEKVVPAVYLNEPQLNRKEGVIIR
jgi:LysM repeat protein/ABC-type branched-subunit amino acid transport system substrate-binding protein